MKLTNDRCFIDSNIFLYLLGDDMVKKNIAKEILLLDSCISTQVINENINVIFKKFKTIPLSGLKGHLEVLLKNNLIYKIGISTINQALFIKDKYHLQWYDSLIISSALQADCKILYSEDMQHNLLVEKKLTIINPFFEQ
jgi:predicted nucleic acid-binding protein